MYQTLIIHPRWYRYNLKTQIKSLMELSLWWV